MKFDCLPLGKYSHFVDFPCVFTGKKEGAGPGGPRGLRVPPSNHQKRIENQPKKRGWGPVEVGFVKLKLANLRRTPQISPLRISLTHNMLNAVHIMSKNNHRGIEGRNNCT